eukprot:364496-Chlamydomonas_euryale.AAC.25
MMQVHRCVHGMHGPAHARCVLLVRLLMFLIADFAGHGHFAQLLELIAPLKKGADATPEDQAEVEAAAAALEELNPTPRPLTSDLLNGGWNLLYTTSASILGLSRPAIFRPSGPIIQVLGAKVYLVNECIYGPGLAARNIEPAPFFNQVDDFTILGSCEKVARTLFSPSFATCARNRSYSYAGNVSAKRGP